jgi:hypothetical protein
MNRLTRNAVALVVVLLCGTWGYATDSMAGAADEPLQIASNPHFLLAPPNGRGPVVVRAAFEIHDVNEINDVLEVFEFTGVLTLTWKDPRQAFEPSAEVNEKVFQGNYQFNELATGWYPQVVLANESGLYQKSGVVLRVQPDGTSTLIETINAAAEVDLDLRWFPFDDHRLEAIFEVLGFDRDEIILQAEPASERSLLGRSVRLPQWIITGFSTSIRDGSASYAGRKRVSSTLVVSVDVERKSFYVSRLVSFPLFVIVFLSFSVFWMDRSSLGDRISISFIGILTGVAYQLVMGDVLPRISYVTLMHAFLTLSFVTMCATVVVNLIVGSLDKRGSYELGDRIDRRCRWIFPLAYPGLILVIFGAASVLF